ncbi:hypothetical protein [Micromonospora sp. WMMD998]|uniref:hypothetical protein n=1 Tax=Micromonospora sp. WMMD998 TaxID=3016092 RepID=UPI00249A8AF2|nr:hypothetical protein [Micromonospora sp. WMMD998]WFE41970.1 hypothetical protein O7619_27380 [Micromonospora sp. WMMD998]
MMKTEIRATATDQDAPLLRKAEALAAQLKAMTPDGMGYRFTVRKYEATVARLGYDPIS